MLGQAGEAVTPIDSANGKIFVEGEFWNAISDTPIKPGQQAEIVAIEGLTLKVKPQTSST
jgi:membrane-bound serine protease (ClpP class)